MLDIQKTQCSTYSGLTNPMLPISQISGPTLCSSDGFPLGPNSPGWVKDPFAGLMEFRITTTNPPESPFVTNNFWRVWQFDVSDSYLQTRMEELRFDVVNSIVESNRMFLPLKLLPSFKAKARTPYGTPFTKQT